MQVKAPAAGARLRTPGKPAAPSLMLSGALTCLSAKPAQAKAQSQAPCRNAHRPIFSWRLKASTCT